MRRDRRKGGRETRKERKYRIVKSVFMRPGRHTPKRLCSTISYILSSRPATSALAGSRNSKHDAPRPERRFHSSAKSRLGVGGQERTGIGNGRDAAQPPKPAGHWWSVQTALVLSPSPGRSSAPTRHAAPQKPGSCQRFSQRWALPKAAEFKGPAWRACRRRHHSSPPWPRSCDLGMR